MLYFYLAKDLIKRRQKLIQLVDGSELGWRLVAEYRRIHLRLEVKTGIAFTKRRPGRIGRLKWIRSRRLEYGICLIVDKSTRGMMMIEAKLLTLEC
jgi:hypothetical protein